jgi:hypothetical protein
MRRSNHKVTQYDVSSNLPLPRPSQDQISYQHPILHNTFSVCSSIKVSDPHKTTDKIIIMYILIFTFFSTKPEDKISCTEWQRAFPDSRLLLTSSRFARPLPKYLNFATFPKHLFSVQNFFAKKCTLY